MFCKICVHSQNNNRLSFSCLPKLFKFSDSTNSCISFDFCSVLFQSNIAKIKIGVAALISLHERRENAAAKKNPAGRWPGKTNQFLYSRVKR